MSKIGNWVVEMQEAAETMTRSGFIQKYGNTQVHIWDEVPVKVKSPEHARETPEQGEQNV